MTDSYLIRIPSGSWGHSNKSFQDAARQLERKRPHLSRRALCIIYLVTDDPGASIAYPVTFSKDSDFIEMSDLARLRSRIIRVGRFSLGTILKSDHSVFDCVWP